MVWMEIACLGRGGGVGWAWGWWMGCKSSMQLCVFRLSSFPTFLSFLTCDFYRYTSKTKFFKRLSIAILTYIRY